MTTSDAYRSPGRGARAAGSHRRALVWGLALAAALWLTAGALSGIAEAGAGSFGIRLELRSAVRIDDPANPVLRDPAVLEVPPPAPAAISSDGRVTVALVGAQKGTVEMYQEGAQETDKSRSGGGAILTILMQ